MNSTTAYPEKDAPHDPAHDLPTLVELLRWRAAHQPDKTGYTFLSNGEDEEAGLTYAELDRQARVIGGLLQSEVRPGERVLLLYPSGLKFVAAFFGCLYSGVIAVPVYPPDPARPDLTLTRFRSIVENSRAAAALTTSAILSKFGGLVELDPVFRAVRWMTTDEVPGGYAEAWRAPAVGRETLAFLQYTSGSTSAPKGVMVSHGNLLHNERTIKEACRHTHESTFVGWLPLYHDMGLIGNVLQPLYLGSRCVLMSPVAFLQRPLRWLEAVSRFGAATSGGPNFAYDLCVRKTTPEQRAALDLSRWTTAFNGAEPVRLESLERFAAAFAVAGFRREAFYPCYGLAEGTLIVSGATTSAPPVTCAVRADALERNRVVPAEPGEEGARTLVGCGRVLGGQKVVIVEPESLKRRAPGEVGEVWLSGPSVAQGYWEQPEQTRQSFRAHTADGEGPFLRTGDLGFLRGGELFVTGRLKDLIIIRGRNHYPQDIEASVERCHPALRPGCGAAFSVEAEGEERLVVVQEVEFRQRPDLGEVTEKIRQAVAEQHDIQAYAVVIIKPGRIPKTSSGKLQRHACRARFLEGALDALSESRVSAPRDEASPPAGGEGPPRDAEGVRAWLVSQLAGRLGLGPGQLDLDKPLVRYGLDSIGVIEHVHSIESVLGVSLPMVMLFQDVSVNQLAAEIQKQLAASSGRAGAEPEAGGAEAGEHELSYGQKAMWFLHQMNPGTQGHITAAVKIRSALDADALGRAFRKLIGRHASLRTSFVARQGQPVQTVSESADLELVREDASGWDESRLDARLAEEAQRPFDLGRCPLLRVRLFELSASERVLLLVIHHIVTDFWSLSVLLHELGLLYSSEKAGAAPALPPLKLNYFDHVRRQDAMLRKEGEGHWRYWREKLAGELPTLNLLTDRPRPPAQTFRGASQPFKLDAELTSALKALAREQGVTLYVALLAAFQTLLFRYTRQEDILVGSPTVGRNSADLAGVVGYFVNPVVVRADLSGDPTFETLLRRVREAVLGAFAHQDYPFALLVERLQPVRDPGHPPIFQTMFALQKAHLLGEEGLSPFALGEGGRKMRLGDLELESFALRERTAQFDLTLLMAEAGAELFGSLEYNADLFDASTVGRMAGHFDTLLRGIVADPRQKLARLPLLAEAERERLVPRRGAARLAHTAEPPVHHLFELRAARRPNDTAVVSESESATYGELNARANRIAHRLRRLGVGPERVVGVLMNRSVDFVAALLGVLKAGGAYLPLDPEYPRERVADMAGGARVAALLTEERYRAALEGLGAPVVSLDAERESLAGESGANPEARVLPQHAAYVIYTSGSTGRPKGVVVSHEGLSNLVSWHRREYGVTGGDRATLLAGISFDASVWELWPYLVSGASLHLPDDETRTSPARLRDWLAARAVSIGFVPTPLAEALLALDWPADAGLRVMLTGGDRLRRYPPSSVGFELVNHYGPTEYTVVASSCRLAAGEADGAAPPIGRPIDRTEILLLDPDLQLVPAGVAGEMCIGGVGLARGYLGDPAQTAERFIPHPFSQGPGARLYRTGDLARLLPDGNLEFLGRTDHQVKIRGFRVEPGEVEVNLSRHPEVADAVVAARPNGRGEDQLVAYFVARGRAPKGAELRKFLKERLPHYMLPAAFVPLESMPLTPNGKVDRRALPAPGHGTGALDEEFAAPRTPVEDVLAGIWAGVLDLEQVGVQDNFFELGGHSLLATQITSRVREAFDVEVPLSSLFANPTVAGLAQWIEAALRDRLGVESPPLLPSPRGAALPVSFAQQRLWFTDQLDPGNPAYNCPAAVSLHGPLDLDALQSCFNYLASRHESLRTTFASIDGLPHQIVSAPSPVHLPLLDLQAHPPGRQQEEVERIAAAEARTRFDLGAGPLLRVTLLRLGGQEHVLLLTLHHIVSDAWSIGVLVREVAQLYECFKGGREPALAELPIQYGDFAVWQREWLRGAELERQLEYWRRQLAGVRGVMELPVARPRPALPSYAGGAVEFRLTRELTRELRELARREDATLFMLLLAGFKALLYRYAGDPEVVVGTGIANRNRVETEGLIGFFVNMLVLRTDLSGEPTFAEALGRVREVCLGAYAHQDVPFEKLVEELQPERAGGHPLFQVMVLFQNAPAPEFQLEGLRLDWVPVPTPTAKFDLTLDLKEEQGALVGRLEYDLDLFDEPAVARMAGQLEYVLEQVAEDPARKLSELSLLREEEAGRVLADWNETRAPRPEECVHERFEAQAAETPDALALISDGEVLTYRELNRRANQLAHYLRRRGVGPEVRVGVCLPRSVKAVVSLLAVFKAGGAYVPLDPTYPADRLAFVRRDARVALLLTDEGLPAAPDLGEGGVVFLDREAQAVALESVENPAGGAAPDNVAYVIYTSGSTGRPKGVMSLHRGAMNRFRWMWEQYPFGAGEVCCQKTSLGFADSVWEIFGPLLRGVPGVIVPDDVVRNPRELIRFLAAHRVTRIVLVPSLLRAMLEETADLKESLPELGFWVSSGEALPADLCEAFREAMPGARLLNLYGSSEVSADSTCFEVGQREPSGSVPIGRPIANTQIYLLDERLRPAPVGVPAELYVGGAGLGRGYLGQPGLTAERFIPDPFAREPGARLYRTGDLARWAEDGNVEYVGRADYQLKIRGFRVELGEVEAALARHPEVRQAVVVALKDAPGQTRLVAYVVAHEAEPPGVSRLRAFVGEQLPDYMIPSAFVFLEALPLTPSGKVNRLALPRPPEERPALEAAYAPPSTPVEKELAAIWAELLRTGPVGADDNFFDLGGHSLMATQLLSRVRAHFHAEVALPDFFKCLTVAGLAALVEEDVLAKASPESVKRLLDLLEEMDEEALPVALALEDAR